MIQSEILGRCLNCSLLSNHVYATDNYIIFGLDDGLEPDKRQAII